MFIQADRKHLQRHDIMGLISSKQHTVHFLTTEELGSATENSLKLNQTFRIKLYLNNSVCKANQNRN